MNPRNNVPDRDVYDKIVRLETPDPWTVRLTLHEPNSAILSYFFAPDGNYNILPEHLLRGRAISITPRSTPCRSEADRFA